LLFFIAPDVALPSILTPTQFADLIFCARDEFCLCFRSEKLRDHSMSMDGGSDDDGDADMIIATHDRNPL